jgi:hypothetical protein
VLEIYLVLQPLLLLLLLLFFLQSLAENNVQDSTILIEPENFNSMLLLLTV